MSEHVHLLFVDNDHDFTFVDKLFGDIDWMLQKSHYNQLINKKLTMSYDPNV